MTIIQRVNIYVVPSVQCTRLNLKQQLWIIFQYKYTSYYIKKDNDELTRLCKKYLANKGYEISQNKNNNFDLDHYQNYSDYYSEIFCMNKDNVKNVLELGIGKE